MGYRDEQPYLYGKLNKEAEKKTYKGLSSSTTDTTVNDADSTIKVDVKESIILDSAEINSDNELVLGAKDGTELAKVQLSGFQQEQSNLAEEDERNETFVKNKSTRYLKNEGEDGTGRYATEQQLHSLESKLNENILRNPGKSYLIWKGNSYPNSTDANISGQLSWTIDFGDGTVLAANQVKNHEYTDGYDYHLITLEIPETALADSTFKNCTSLVKAFISNTIIELGADCFNGCQSVTELIFGDENHAGVNKVFNVNNGVIFLYYPISNLNIGDTVRFYDSDDGSLMVERTVKAINNTGVKRGNRTCYLLSVDGDKLATEDLYEDCILGDPAYVGFSLGYLGIGNHVFYNCKSLKRIRISGLMVPEPGDILETNSSAKIVVPKLVYDEWKSAWSAYADKIVYEIDSSDLTPLATDAQLNLLEAKLNENIIKDPSKTYLVWSSNNFPNSENAQFKAPAGCTIDWGDGSIETFSTGSASVNTHTYTDNVKYHLISISGMTSIPILAFNNCKDLKKVLIGDEVTSMLTASFAGSGVEEVTLGKGIENPGDSVFNGCTSLLKLILRKTYKLGNMFENCSNLTTIEGKYTSARFNRCSSIERIEYSDGETTISQNFNTCESLEYVKLSDTTTAVESLNFDTCSKLDTVVIPKNVKTIHLITLTKCTMKRLVMQPTTPPTAPSTIVLSSDIDKIIVPKESIDAYKTATGWSTYADKIVYEVDSSDIPTFGEGLVEENKEVKIDNTKVPIFEGADNALNYMPVMFDLEEWFQNQKLVLKPFNAISVMDNDAYEGYPKMFFTGTQIDVYQPINLMEKLYVNDDFFVTGFAHITRLGTDKFCYDSENGKFDLEDLKYLVVPRREGTLAIAEEVAKDLDNKLNTSGGIITGDLVINGDLTVKGTEILENIENLNVKNPMIYANADKATLLDNGGLGINVNSTDTYGIVYNPTTNSVELGLGKADANGKFTFNANEGNPVAIRSNDNKLTDKHLIAWNSTDRKLVDSGKTVDDFVDLVNPQTIEGLKTFKDETQFSSNVTHSGDVVITNKVLKILSTVGDLATQYNADKIVIDNGTGSTAVTYTLTLPKDTGTLALNKFKYSEFKSSNDGDAWVLNDSTKNVEIHYKDENSYSSLAIEKDFIEIFDINGTGTAKISMASNVITVDSESTEGKHKIIQMSPDMIKVGNTSDDTLVQIDSTSTKFNNRPQVKFNGNYVDVAIKDDLDNYVPIQSEANGYYSQVSNENGQFSVRVFQNGDEDLQNLIVNKDGVTVLGKKLATDTELNALEAKLNENIVKDPSKTYVIVTGNVTASASAPVVTSGTVIDWGDGSIDTITTEATLPAHTYTDGKNVHIISFSNYGNMVAFLSQHTFREVYIGNNVKYVNLLGTDARKVEILPNDGGIYNVDNLGVNQDRNLPELVVPDSVTYISSIVNVVNLILKGTTPPTLGGNLQVTKIVVPKSAINAYKTASEWSAFADKIVYEIDSSDLESKLDKFTNTSSYDRAYIQNSAGNEVGSNIDYEPSAYSLARRNATGQLQVGDPLTGNDAVNKLSMENAIKATRIAHISNSLLGG